MSSPVTVIAPAKLAEGVSESELLSASNDFQETFVRHEPGILRRELVRKTDSSYMDIVQFRSQADAEEVMTKEMKSEAFQKLVSLLDMSEVDMSQPPEMMTSLQTHV